MEGISLYSCEKLKNYKVKSFSGRAIEITQKLDRIGLRVGETICVIGQNYGRHSLLVKIKGVSFALDSSICKGVIVESA